MFDSSFHVEATPRKGHKFPFSPPLKFFHFRLSAFDPVSSSYEPIDAGARAAHHSEEYNSGEHLLCCLIRLIFPSPMPLHARIRCEVLFKDPHVLSGETGTTPLPPFGYSSLVDQPCSHQPRTNPPNLCMAGALLTIAPHRPLFFLPMS